MSQQQMQRHFHHRQQQCKQNVCMFVYNEFRNDTRVLKEARTLAQAGYRVRIIALAGKGLPSYEKAEHFEVFRVEKDPFHYQFLRWLKPLPAKTVKLIPKSTTLKAKLTRGRKKVIATVKPRWLSARKKWKTWYAPRRKKWASKWNKWFGDVGSPAPQVQLAGAARLSRAPDTSGEGQGGDCSPIANRKHVLSAVEGSQIADQQGPLPNPPPAYRGREEQKKKPTPSWIRRTIQKTGDGIYTACNRTLLAFHAPICFMDFYQRARPTVDANRSDIYHAHDLNTLPVAWWYARRHRARLVYDSHELYTERNSKVPLTPVAKFSWRTMERTLIRKSHGVITVNSSIARVLAERYRVGLPTVVMNTPPRTVQPSPNGHNLLRSALPVKPDQKLLIYSGAITFNRGLEKVIESLIYLPDCFLVMMGYGVEKYKDELRKVVERHQLQDRFCFYGPVAPDLVTMYAAGADLGVAPIQNVCLSYYLCSPNKLFEYVIAGIPVIASDFPELKDVVDRFKIGVTFDPEDPKDIARAADEILRNPQRAADMRRNTAAAADAFNWENESAKLLELYRTLR